MTETVDRLERFVRQELDDCCSGDIDDRLASLEAMAEDVGDDIDRDVGLLKALGNETRYTIVRLLDAADGELCVCEITPVVDVSASAVSHALSDLNNAGLVTRRKEGTWRYYRLNLETKRILEALDSTYAREQ